MKKHAYLIMAHNNFDLLQKELYLLDDERNDIFIHIDKKAKNVDQAYITEKVKHSNVYFLPRISINWGGYSIAQCTVELLKKAIETDVYEYYHLLSGADLPLKTQDQIHDFFHEHKGMEFVSFDKAVPNEKDIKRVKRYYLFQDIYGRNRKNIFYVFLFLVDKLSVKVQDILKVDRYKNSSIELQKGAEWFSITHEMASLVVKKQKWIKKHFKYTRCCDEVFIQTIVNNSNRKKYIFQQGFWKGKNACLRKIDWGRGKPYTWTINEKEELLQSECLFARKFDSKVDNDIIDYLVTMLKDNQ